MLRISNKYCELRNASDTIVIRNYSKHSFILYYNPCLIILFIQLNRIMYKDVKAYYQNLVPHITEMELAAMEKCFTVRQLQKGDFLIKAGQVCRYVYFINHGLLRIFYSFDGKDISIGFAGTGEYTSEYESFLTRQPAAQNIEALTNVEVVELGFDDIQILYKLYPVFQEFGRKIAEMLYIMLNQRNAALLAISPEDRYRQMIESNSYLLQNVPQYMLASFIGVTPEHLSRIRKKITKN
ncbi:MAG: Crp/Fnr family transcriptional regulator [Chitinophagaceae bacterium]